MLNHVVKMFIVLGLFSEFSLHAYERPDFSAEKWSCRHEVLRKAYELKLLQEDYFNVFSANYRQELLLRGYYVDHEQKFLQEDYAVLKTQRDLLRAAYSELKDRALLVTCLTSGCANVAERVDWAALRELSSLIMTYHAETFVALKELENSMGMALPSGSLNIPILRAVEYSAFIDFLLSPWADDEKIVTLFPFCNPILLTASSLWRAYLVMAPGNAQLQNADGKFAVQFSSNPTKEQERFQAAYARIANFECVLCPSTYWSYSVTMGGHRADYIDLEERLHPNNDSDSLRRDEINWAMINHYDRVLGY